jgi:hypothetical protein
MKVTQKLEPIEEQDPAIRQLIVDMHKLTTAADLPIGDIFSVHFNCMMSLAFEAAHGDKHVAAKIMFDATAECIAVLMNPAVTISLAVQDGHDVKPETKH